MNTGIGPEFLRLLREISWDSLTARDAVDLRAALKEAISKSDEWFLNLTRDFREKPGEVELIHKEEDPEPGPSSNPPNQAPVQTSSPAKQRSKDGRWYRYHPEEKPGKRGKVKARGRVDLKVNRPEPLAVGGADAEGETRPQPAKLFENSYISKDGPRADIPASLPADHPRLGIHRESSVTPEVDAQDFQEVEAAMKTGRGVKDIFQVK